jgi:hypothetical protein
MRITGNDKMSKCVLFSLSVTEKESNDVSGLVCLFFLSLSDEYKEQSEEKKPN